VAPPGNQAATENTNFGLNAGEEPAYSPLRIYFPGVRRAQSKPGRQMVKREQGGRVEDQSGFGL